MPHLPEMVFPNNILKVVHSEGFGIEFNALDALKLVDPDHDLMKVGCAEEWKAARYLWFSPECILLGDLTCFQVANFVRLGQ